MSMRKCLIVDDDIDFAEAMAELLSMSDLDVTIAHTGEDGIDLARANDYEFALFDVGLPGRNGSECVSEILSFKPEINCILMTGYSNSTLTSMGIDVERFNIMLKPLKFDQLSTLLSI